MDKILYNLGLSHTCETAAQPQHSAAAALRSRSTPQPQHSAAAALRSAPQRSAAAALRSRSTPQPQHSAAHRSAPQRSVAATQCGTDHLLHSPRERKDPHQNTTCGFGNTCELLYRGGVLHEIIGP